MSFRLNPGAMRYRPSDDRTHRYWLYVNDLLKLFSVYPDLYSPEELTIIRERYEAERSKLLDGFEPMADDSASLARFVKKMAARTIGKNRVTGPVCGFPLLRRAR